MKSRSSPDVVEILLVEDEAADAALVHHALTNWKMANNLHHVADGREALKFLRNAPLYEAAPRPDLILLDLNMPIMNGKETLAAIKKDPELCTIPVVVMTSSNRSEDIATSYELSANCYVRKPLDYAEFTQIVEAIESFWFGIVTLPTRRRPQVGAGKKKGAVRRLFE